MITPAQAAARAENGRRHSTGPKTPEGKAASRANATKHGAYSQSPVILRGPMAEDPRDFEVFNSGVVASLNTEGTVEDALGSIIGGLLWRSRRIPAIEAIYLATAAAQPPSMDLAQAERLHPWHETAARVLRDPDGNHSLDEYKTAAIAAGHAVGLDMDDDWPQPPPTTPDEWNALIDATLAHHNLTRDQAAASCDKEAARWKDRRQAGEAEHQAAEIVRLVDGDLLTKITRIEAHFGRELTRNLGLLISLQADRKSEQ